MSPVNGIWNRSLRNTAAAALALLAASPAAPAGAKSPTPGGGGTSASANPSVRCDLKFGGHVEQSFEHGRLMLISSYDDDPFVQETMLNGPSPDQSNALSRMSEAWGALVGGVAMRDGVNDATVSTTSPEVHDRSEVLTGAVYQVFLSIYGDLSHQRGAPALEQAGAIMASS
jgi:hypothetical protein